MFQRNTAGHLTVKRIVQRTWLDGGTRLAFLPCLWRRYGLQRHSRRQHLHHRLGLRPQRIAARQLSEQQRREAMQLSGFPLCLGLCLRPVIIHWRDRGLPWRAGVVRGEALVCVRGQGSSVAKSWSPLEVRDHPWRCVRLLWRPVIISSEVVVCCGDQGSTHGAPAANVRPSATRLLWPAAAAVAAAAICVVLYSQWQW